MILNKLLNNNKQLNIIPMPTPPRESISGTKGHQVAAFEFSKTSYNYLVELERFMDTEEFTELDLAEKDLILGELEEQTKAYEILWERVDQY
jgi:hypothetical protein